MSPTPAASTDDLLGYQRNATSQALLREARREFSELGIAGGRVARIAERAGVNKERIYAYFGSKERLFDIVLAEALAELVDLVPLAADDDLGEHVVDSLRRHRAAPDLPRLLMWEALHYGTAPAAGTRAAAAPGHRTELYRRKVEMVGVIIGTTDVARAAAASFWIIGLATWGSTTDSLSRLIGSAAGGAASDVDRVDEEIERLARVMAAALVRPDVG